MVFLVIKEQESLLNGFEALEFVDLSLLDRIIQSKDLKIITDKKKKYKTEKEWLMLYRRKIVDSFASVKYNYSKKINFGRVFPENLLSVGALRRPLRHMLCKNNYVDIDTVSSQQSILYNVCKLNNFETPYLLQYIENRESILKQVQESYNVDRDTAKELFITLTNGGNFTGWIYTYNLNSSFIPFEFINNYKNEMSNIIIQIYNDNQEFFKIIEKKNKKEEKTNMMGSFISSYIQEIEKRILECMYKFISQFLKIKNNVILCHDGIMIFISDFRDSFISLLEQEIKRVFNFDIKLKVKDMDESINLQKEIETYDQVKDEFEKNHFKVRYPLMFIQENEGYFEHCYKSKKGFLDAYQNKPKYDKITKKGECERVSFVDDWVKDEFMREYEKVDFIPYGPTQEYKEDKRIYNTFTGYEINKNKFDVEDVDMSDFIDYFIHLCGNRWDIYEFFRKYLSHILKYPRDKSRVACVIKSNQGCGKGTLAEILTAIFGSKYIFEDTGISAFTDRFNGAVANKLIGIIDEAKASDGFSNPEKIKKIISDKTQWIEPKGGEKYEISSYINLIFFTNNDVVVKIEASDRRFQLWNASNKYQNNTDFFSKLREKYINDEKGLYAVYKWFLDCDVKQGYDFSNNRVITEEYKQNQALQVPIIIKFFEYLEDEQYKQEKYMPLELFTEFKKYCSIAGFKIEPNIQRFGLDVKTYCPFIEKKKSNNIYYYINHEMMTETLQKYEIEKIEFVDEE
jgi:hypothetical protein